MVTSSSPLRATEQHQPLLPVFVVPEHQNRTNCAHHPTELKAKVLLHQPAFGGVERTSSELRLMDDAHHPLYISDALWSLNCHFKPIEIMNSVIHSLLVLRKSDVRLDCLWQTVKEGDPMTDRSREFVRKLKFLNVSVVHIFNPGGFHGLEMTDALALFEAVKNFIYSTRGVEVEVSRASY
ncbi:unnamed protein product [Fraxinus pennsylvanica]|uniref:Uncharacterized protein n=1 Tax=Fraxinus pennsylvanica TaxID=56036 RepID=A0AAD2A6G8_9LAMI|nr:unnamed protein product [Fraxinus pennsylvanica]